MGAGLVSLAFEEDATDKVMEDLEAEGAIVKPRQRPQEHDSDDAREAGARHPVL